MGWLDRFFSKPKQQIREVASNERAIALQQLQESFNDQPDFFAALMDRYYSGGQWYQPIGGIPMFGGTSNRMHGKDTYGGFYTEQDLRFQRDAARLLFAREPVAKAIEGHMNAFVIGKGMSYKISPKKDYTEEYATDDGKKRLSKYQQAIDEWLDEQRWPEREQECYTCKMVDGEFFLWVTTKGGKIQVRRLEPEHIQNPPGKTYIDGWYLGVKYNLKDAETPLAYGYKPDYVEWQEIPAEQIIHFKANVTRNVSRGISDFYPITDDLKSISQLVDNIRDGAMARAEIAYMWSVKNATPAAISAFADDKADRSRVNSITGKTNRSKGQQSGKAVAHGDNVEFTTMPQGDVEGSVSALQASLRMVGNRFCMPEYMVSADASNANYASTQMAGTPFVRKVEIEQNLLKRPFKQILTMVMEQAVVKGIIPTSEYAKLDIEIECGSPVIEDEYQQAQMFDIMRRNGVISPQKWCMAKGMDYEEVQRDLNEWNEQNMQAPDLGGAAGGTVFGAMQQDKQNAFDDGEQDIGPVKESWDEGKHPRVEAGHSGGGEFTAKGNGDKANGMSKKERWEHEGWSERENELEASLSKKRQLGHASEEEIAQHRELNSKWQHLKDKKMLTSKTGVKNGKMSVLDISSIDLLGQRLHDVSPMEKGNKEQPVIVAKHKDGYKLLDGYGRTNGMLNAGHNKIHAIIASDADINKFKGNTSDNDEFVQYMYGKYTKGLKAGTQGSIG